MPGPQPKYESIADKQKAYRERNRERLRLQREEVAELQRLTSALHGAVHRAAVAGDQVAGSCDRSERLLTLGALVDHFDQVAGMPEDERPHPPSMPTF